MYCPTCSKAFPDNHAFCDNCGGKLVNEHANVAPVAQAPVQPAPYTQQQNTGYQQGPAPTYNPQQGPAQSYNPQPAYTPPNYTYNNAPQGDQTLSTLGWIGYFVLFGIPLVGFITMLVLAFGNPRKKFLKSYARAVLILALIGIVLSAIMGIFFWPAISDMIYNNFNIDLSDLSNFSY